VGNLHKLIIEDDEGKTTVVPLSRGEITVGRMEGNTIRLMERNVSRRHARLVRDAGSIFIEDLNSFNGVKINGERITKRLELREGDLVEIGDYHLALQAQAVEDDATSRVDTTLEAAAPVVAKTNGSHGATQSGWSSAAGTVPDLALSPESMREARRQYEAATNDAPTANLRASALGPPDPLVSPPSPKAPGGASLPPFPGPLPSPMFVEPGLAAQRAKDEAASRTEQIRVGAQRTADVTRLVCVSTEYAGRDFPLTRSETVIGRLEDNDVVIEHRSVSKQHAKILFDGRVHKIVDLESANGILVNGEEYAITDLRRGDLVELGHVKFRFVLAGEDFVPTGEEIDAMRAVGVEPQLAVPRPSFGDAPTGPQAAQSAFAPGTAGQPAAAPAAGSAAALAALASGFGAPSSASKAPSSSLRDPAPFRLEPPTVPLQAHLAPQLSPSVALRELASRDLAASARTEQMLAHDTVEMPVNMDLSNAATVTDTPISALEGELPKPSIEPMRVDPPREAQSDVPTQRPGDRSGYGSGGSRPVVEPAFDGVRRGGSLGAVTTTRIAPSDDDDLRPARGEARSPRGLMAGVAVLALVAGLVFVVLKLTGGAVSPGLDQELAALVQRGELEKAESYYLANVEGFADKRKAAALFAEAKNKAAVQREVARPPSEPARPAPTQAAEASPTQALPTEAAPTPGRSSSSEASAAPRPTEAVGEPIPEGEEPDSALVGRAVVSPGTSPAASPARRDRTAERAPKRTPAADPKKSLEDAKRSYTDGFQAFMYGDPSRAKMHALSCLKSAEYPPCHSLLGRIYAQEDKVRESVKHYKQYLELAPNAPDASKVREIVANAEKSQ
jgi:pSer/pThr/pTyr-binding forkhead associated (FHA) protein